MLLLPIAFSANLNVDEFVSTVPAGNKDLGRVNVCPDSFRSCDLTLDLTFAHSVNHAAVVLEDIGAGCQSHIGTQGEKCSDCVLHIFCVRLGQTVKSECQWAVIEVWNAYRRRYEPLWDIGIGTQRAELRDVHRK